MANTMAAEQTADTEQFEVRVTARTNVGDSTIVLTLEPSAAGNELPTWEPGAHIDVHTPAGTRNYSLFGSPSTPSWEIAVLRNEDGAGGSRWLHQNAYEGTVLRCGGPRNSFPLEPAQRYLFIAGGIGITPLLPMARRADELGASWRLIHTARDQDILVLSSGAGIEPRVTAWCSRPGRFAFEREIDALTADDLIYCCASDSLMRSVVDYADKAGVPVRTERFAPAKVEGDRSFTIKLAKSGGEVVVPSDRPALDVLNEAGFFIPSSCRSGHCGTCETEVISGEIDHRDEVLTDEERDENTCMFPCVSRAAGDAIVLDL